MPGIASTLLREQLRLIKPIVSNFSVEAERAAQDKLGALGAHALSSKVRISPVKFEKYTACFISPADDPEPERTILYLHGGGYVAGDIHYAVGFGSVLAEKLGARVFCAAYRLAPEDPFPAALEDALHAYKYLLGLGNAPEDISFAGESAGGGLIFALCLKLREEGLPFPAALAALSPWTDLTFSGATYDSNRWRDPTLSEQSLRGFAEAYAPENAKNPLVSPVFGDFTGFPPSLIIAGGDELLLDDARMLDARLDEYGCKHTLYVEPGMWHVYAIFGTPEAQKALEMMKEALCGQDKSAE